MVIGSLPLATMGAEWEECQQQPGFLPVCPLPYDPSPPHVHVYSVRRPSIETELSVTVQKADHAIRSPGGVLAFFGFHVDEKAEAKLPSRVTHVKVPS